jgi:hypothetical protein
MKKTLAKSDLSRLEVLDEAMAEVLRRKTLTERLAIR